MRARTLLLLAALAGCADGASAPTGPGASVDLSRGRSFLVDAYTYVESADGALAFGDQSNGGNVRGWAAPVSGGGETYPLGQIQANGNEATYFVERAGYRATLQATAYAPKCRFRRWVLGLDTYGTSPVVHVGNHPDISSFKAEFICTA